MSIWNKRGEFPKDFTDTRGLFVYQFDDGVDVEGYDEAFIYAANLIRWCRWNDLVYFEKENKQQQAEINRLRTALENLIEAFLILKRFYPTTTLFADEHIKNINKALNGESEVKC